MATAEHAAVAAAPACVLVHGGAIPARRVRRDRRGALKYCTSARDGRTEDRVVDREDLDVVDLKVRLVVRGATCTGDAAQSVACLLVDALHASPARGR